MSNNWKQTSAKTDPFWHTIGEARNLNASASLSNGGGDDDGRMSNLLQLSSAPMGGMQVVVNVQLNGSGEMSSGFGIRYKAKGLYLFADTLKIENDADGNGFSDDNGLPAGESATKFGGKYTMDKLTVGLTLEQAEDLVSYDYMTMHATYGVNANDTIMFTYGQAEHITTAAADTDTMVLGYHHSMSKRTAVYAAYADVSSDTVANEASGFTFGLKHSF